MTKFKSLMIEIILKIKMFFELLFKIEIKKALIPIFIASLFLCSCTPQKRVARIVEKYNLSIKDTTILKADTLATVFSKEVFSHDTIFTVVNERQSQTIYIKGDTVQITTIVPEKQIITERINVQPSKKNKVLVAMCVFSLIGLIFVIVIHILTMYNLKKIFK